MLYIALLLLVPLTIRYLTSWHMAQLRLRMVRGDEDVRQLHEQYLSIRDNLADTRRRLRQFEVRKSFIANDIHRERQRLTELRSARTSRRMAAAA